MYGIKFDYIRIQWVIMMENIVDGIYFGWKEHSRYDSEHEAEYQLKLLSN